ncbi:tyrosine-type recombinase/integrase [Latilactobacillus sakei]
MFKYDKNNAITEYISKGERRYLFRIYVGINPETHKKSVITRRGFKTPAAANAEFRKIEARVKNDKYVFKLTDSPALTFHQAYLKWFSESYRTTVQSSTTYKTKQIFDCHILPEIGSIPLNEITPKLLQPIVNRWADKYANRIFKYAYTINLITSNQKDKLKYALDVNFD